MPEEGGGGARKATAPLAPLQVGGGGGLRGQEVLKMICYVSYAFYVSVVSYLSLASYVSYASFISCVSYVS